MPTPVNIHEFLDLARVHPVLDVRTPAEYETGHIPGAHNLPLFTNEERVVVGTLYKREGKQPAILKGLEFIGPRMKQVIKSASAISKEGTFLMHCWRGGMRSGSVAWLLEIYGYKVYTLRGGYKLWRRLVLETFSAERKLTVIGGRTGAGKTDILHALARKGEQVLDLEYIAAHKGSSFGALGERKPPTQEQFQNELAFALMKLDAWRTVWVEDESRMVGSKVIPDALWAQMRSSKVFYIDIPFTERAKYLTELYGKFGREELKAAIERIRKRLGGLETQNALAAIDNGELQKACEISLAYYDKAYDHGLSQREHGDIIRMPFETLDSSHIADEIIRQSAL